jgi:hypothetical protein
LRESLDDETFSPLHSGMLTREYRHQATNNVKVLTPNIIISNNI